MTEAQRAELLASQIRLEGKMDTAMAVMAGSIETLTARLNAHLEKSTAETKALFAGRREQSDKIENIRVDYVPRADFNSHRRNNREEHEAMLSAINCVQWKVAKIAGGITLLAFIAGLVVKGIGAISQ